ncbi:zinc ABC transporter solute-binding protein [Aerophototrophica crusticola]|uniref:High-affinity zinc uptake system protein ZnuA n=1 Tax=Aerophototrophica crusticola TaxID=1709002 RepID=A0A858RB16_9PROT|nr:zinc ABC transporter solute-binding protein [Rhodospirillaceae bacterium B3]
MTRARIPFRRLAQRAAALLIPLALAPAALAQGAPPDVVATVKPLHSLVAGVMQGVGTPHLLVQGAANPHAFSLKPSDAKALAGAELVVWVGPELETFLQKPLAAVAGKARLLPLMTAPGVQAVETRAGGVWDQHDHGHGHGHGHSHGPDDHGGGGPDGHIWLDPRNAKAITDAVAEALAALDPARAATYRANAEAQRARIDSLDAELAATLAPVAKKPFIVFHDAYHYLERRYGLSAAGAITVSPERRPGAARLSALRERIRQAGAACVFAEPQFAPALVQTVAEGTNARTGTLDPEGANIPDGPELYFSLMRFNAKSLADCLGG